MHYEVQLHVVKSWPLESKPTGEAYFTSGTIKHFRTGSYSQHRALNVSSVNLWIEESSLPGLLEEEGDTDRHKQVRHWSNARAWVIGASELLNTSTFPVWKALSAVCNKVSQVPWDHPGDPVGLTRVGLKMLWAELSHGIPLARLRAVFCPRCTQKTSHSINQHQDDHGDFVIDNVICTHELQISNIWFPMTYRSYCNNSSSGKQMPVGDIWRMINGGKAGRAFSLKAKESAPKNVTEETFLPKGRRPSINLSPWVKYICCQILEWDNREAHTATFSPQ